MVRKVKTPESDNRVVDYLYDDLPDVGREDFVASLESDEAGAAEAESYATLLKIYRAESDELTPSVAATESLMRAAERAHLSLWARLFGDLLPRMVLRPAVGFAMVAALVVGGGVFYVLSQGQGQRPESGVSSAEMVDAPKDRTLARAPASPSRSTRTVLAEKGPTGGVGKNGLVNQELAVDGKDKGIQAAADEDDGDSSGFRLKDNRQGALAGKGGADRDRSERYQYKVSLRGRTSRRRNKAKKREFARVVSKTRGGAQNASAPGTGRGAAKSEQRPLVQAADSLRAVQKKPASANQAPKGQPVQKLAPPALHKSARKNLAKGKVAVACRMFGALVRGHRSYNRRADALLGWARCEIARGSYSRAKQILRQLVSQYPKWKKTGATLVAQINRLQARAALRAQRVKRVRRKAVPSRAAPARRARSRRSTTSD